MHCFTVAFFLASPVASSNNRLQAPVLLGDATQHAAQGLPAYLDMPIDHFVAKDRETWQLKYYVNDARFRDGGALLLKMPDEMALSSCPLPDWGAALGGALVICAEHRFFGTSIPGNSSTVEALRTNTVEQNLADQVALVHHIRSRWPSLGPAIAFGGSYAGASSAWIRHLYPEVIYAAIALSPPVVARVAFPEYDTSNLVALASLDYRCAQTMARIAEALDRQLATNRTALMQLFNADYYITSEIGDGDFMYGLGDATYSAIQYGKKSQVCQALRPLYGRNASDVEYTELYANYTLTVNGASYFSSCWYNSTCMRESTHAFPAESARSWYWKKCTQLGYFQVAPQSGLRARPKGFTIEAALAQCAYAFPGAQLISEESVKAFNQKFGGAVFGGTSRIFELDFSDDPWKMSTSVSLVTREAWVLGLDQPFAYLTCDGCGHMGYGLSPEQQESVTAQIVAVLHGWGVSGQEFAKNTDGRDANTINASVSALDGYELTLFV